MQQSILLAALFLCGLANAQTEIYNEDFQSGIPVSYTLVDNDGFTVHPSVSEFAPAWISLEDPDVAGDTVAGSTSYFSPAARADRWLITPSIALGAFGNVLFWEGKSHDASFTDGYYVLISTTDTQLASFNDTLFYTSAETADWSSHEVSLSAKGYDNVTVHIAFVNRTNDGFKLYLDDIRVEEENPLSLEQLSTKQLVVSPNPFNDLLTISGEFDQAQILNLSGEVIYSGSEQQIATSSFPAGVYILNIQRTDGLLENHRIVKN